MKTQKTTKKPKTGIAVACPHCRAQIRVTVARVGAGRPRKAAPTMPKFKPADRRAVLRILGALE